MKDKGAVSYLSEKYKSFKDIRIFNCLIIEAFILISYKEKDDVSQAALFQIIQNINNMMWLSVNIINHIQYDILRK